MTQIFLTDSASAPNGARQQLLMQAQGLQAAGYTPRILGAPGSDLAARAARGMFGFSEVDFSWLQTPLTFAKITQLLIRHKPLAVLCHGDQDAQWMALVVHLLFTVGWLRHKPLLLRMRLCGARPVQAWLVNWAFDLTLAGSRELRDRLLNNRFIDPKRVDVLHPMVEVQALMKPTEALSPTTRAALDNKPEAKVLLQSGSVTLNSEHDFILSLLPTWIEQQPDLIYLVRAEGDGLEGLRSQVASMGLESHVVWADPSDALSALLERAHVLLEPKSQTGLGLNPLRAIVSGVPVVTSHLGSLGALDDQAGVSAFCRVCQPPHVRGAAEQWLSAVNALCFSADQSVQPERGQQWVNERFGVAQHIQALLNRVESLGLLRLPASGSS